MVTIIGAGLSGLAIAYRLHKAGVPHNVLEATPQVGGRVQAASLEYAEHGQHDLGPSWVWPYAQPVAKRWLRELSIETFPQYDQGNDLIDRQADTRAFTHFLPRQHGIERIKGGTHAIVRSLISQLNNVYCNQKLTSFGIADGSIHLEVSENGKPVALSTDQLVIAIPPRLTAPLLSNVPELDRVSSILRQTPTWMASQAKVVIRYEHPFWRNRDLSGRVASSVGPLAEMHDHCGPKGYPAALFGFVGIPAKHRIGAQEKLLKAIKQQLVRCFGMDSPEPKDILIKDWAFEKNISTDDDLKGPAAHPLIMNKIVRQAWCNNNVWLAGSETAAISPGLIEGAFARADQVAENIVKLKNKSPTPIVL